MSTPNNLSFEYRVVSLSEAGNDLVNVSFVEQREGVPNAPTPYGNFTRAFTPAEADSFFPGQVYTLTLTLES